MNTQTNPTAIRHEIVATFARIEQQIAKFDETLPAVQRATLVARAATVNANNQATLLKGNKS